MKSIGKRDRGPGEFYLPIKFYIKNGKIFFIDFRKIHIYSLNGELIKSFKIDFDGTDIKVNSINEIIVVGMRDNKIFHIYNLEGKLLHSFWRTI